MAREKPRKKHNMETVMMAIEDVEVNGLSLRVTARKYGIAKETLRNHLYKHRNGIEINLGRPGPPPFLREDEELMLFRWMFESTKRGFYMRRSEIANCLQNYLNANERKTLFKDNNPQGTFFKQFRNRHPKLHQLPRMSKMKFKLWFELIAEHVFQDDPELLSIVQHADRMFMAEEIRFALNPNGVNISADIPDMAEGEDSEDNSRNKLISILLNFNLAGEAGPPHIVYPLEEIPSEISATIPSAWGVGKNPSGLMDSELLYNYIENVFVPYLTQYNVQLPVILLLNPELTPISLRLFELCRKEKIVLIGLYELAIGILGRCRVTAFNILENWLAYHPYSEFRMDQLTAIVNLFFEHTTTLTWSLVEEFRFCGLFPWGSSYIDERHLSSNDQLNKSLSKVKLASQVNHHHHQHQLPTTTITQAVDSVAAVNSISQHQHHPGQVDLQFLFDQSDRYPKRPPTSSVSTSTDDNGPTINYARFCEIVGQSLVDHCERTSASKEFDLGRDNLIILRKIFNELQPAGSKSSLPNQPQEQTTSNDLDLPLNNGTDNDNELSLLNFLKVKPKHPQRPATATTTTAAVLANNRVYSSATTSVPEHVSGLTIRPSVPTISHHHHHQQQQQHHQPQQQHSLQHKNLTNSTTTATTTTEPPCNLELSFASFYQ